MRYQRKSSIAYMFRNFWHLFPLGAVAAVLLAFFLNSTPVTDFVRAFWKGQIESQFVLDGIVKAYSVLRFGKLWWCTVIAVLVFVFVESMLMAKVSRHMRIGEMPLFPVKSANAAVPTLLLFVLGVTFFVELLNLIVVGIVFLVHSAGDVVMVVTASALSLLVEVLAMFLVGTLMFAFPIMFAENYSFNQALSYSVRLMSEKRRFLWLLAVSFPLSNLALSAITGLVDILAVTVGLYFLFYLFWTLFIPCVVFKMYYDSVGGERRDIMQVMW